MASLSPSSSIDVAMNQEPNKALEPRHGLSRSVLAHGSRQPKPWLIFNVRPTTTTMRARESRGVNACREAVHHSGRVIAEHAAELLAEEFRPAMCSAIVVGLL